MCGGTGGVRVGGGLAIIMFVIQKFSFARLAVDIRLIALIATPVLVHISTE